VVITAFNFLTSFPNLRQADVTFIYTKLVFAFYSPTKNPPNYVESFFIGWTLKTAFMFGRPTHWAMHIHGRH